MESYEPRESPLSLKNGFNNTGSDIGDALLVMADVGDPGSFDLLVKLPTATTSPIFGVTRGILKNGTVGSIGQGGRLIGTAGATITPGQRLYAMTTGKLSPTAPGSGANLSYVGLSVSGGVADEKIEFEAAKPGDLHQGA